MAKPLGKTDQMRSIFLMSELQLAQNRVKDGPVGMLVRITLAVIFVNLAVISYSMMGIIGPVFMSALFLAACLMPCVYHVVKLRLGKRRLPEQTEVTGVELRQDA